MFLCKRVRSEVGVDSVGVGGGEPGGPAGGALRLVVTRPVDESTRWPCASGRACSSPWRAPRPGGPSGVADPPATAVRAAASSEEIVAAVLGGPRGSVAGRLDRVGGAEVTRRRAGGRPGRRCSSPRPSPAPAAVWGYSRARVGLAEGARGPSGGLLVGGGAGSGARRRRPPCGPRRRRTARVARTGVDHAGGDHGVGPGPPRAASGRPAGPSQQHTISTPLAPPCWPDRAHTRRPSRRPPPRPGSRSLSHVLDAVHAPRPRRCGFGRPRHPVVGADHRRGSRPRWITG